MVQNQDIKKQLSSAVVETLRPNETIYIDTGTTMMELVKQIPDNLPLVVVTNDLEIALELEHKFNVTTIMIGGTIKRGTHTVIDNGEDHVIDSFNFQKVIMSPAGIIKEGFTFLNYQAMSIRQKATKRAEQLIMVADSSKLGTMASVLGFHFSPSILLYTNKCDEDWKKFLSQQVQLHIVS
jgi:DeoR/GlpR family transcriptional regulator of sugar metabolism